MIVSESQRKILRTFFDAGVGAVVVIDRTERLDRAPELGQLIDGGWLNERGDENGWALDIPIASFIPATAIEEAAAEDLPAAPLLRSGYSAYRTAQAAREMMADPVMGGLLSAMRANESRYLYLQEGYAFRWSYPQSRLSLSELGEDLLARPLAEVGYVLSKNELELLTAEQRQHLHVLADSRLEGRSDFPVPEWLRDFTEPQRLVGVARGAGGGWVDVARTSGMHPHISRFPVAVVAGEEIEAGDLIGLDSNGFARRIAAAPIGGVVRGALPGGAALIHSGDG